MLNKQYFWFTVLNFIWLIKMDIYWKIPKKNLNFFAWVPPSKIFLPSGHFQFLDYFLPYIWGNKKMQKNWQILLQQDPQKSTFMTDDLIWKKQFKIKTILITIKTSKYCMFLTKPFQKCEIHGFWGLYDRFYSK